MNICSQQAKNNFLLYYQVFLVVISVFIFFTELDNYLFNLGIAPAPKFLIIAIGAAAIPLLSSFSSLNRKIFPTGVVIWCSLFLGISVIYYQFATPTEAVQQELETRILSGLYLLIMAVIFLGDSLLQICARWTIFLVTFINVFNNIYELLNPLAFNGFNITGRPAGFYIDPNKSGCALILGMIFSITLLPIKYRLPFFIAVFIGVFFTFSRGALLCMILLFLLFLMTGIIPKINFKYLVVVILFIFLIGGNLGNFLINQAKDLGLLSYSIEKRIEAFTNPGDTEALQADDGTSRLNIVYVAWNSFSKQPFFGNGIAYVREWGDILPHNIYLTFMVEHGFLGAFILPLLIFLVIQDGCGENKNIGYLFAIFILIWGFFSHTILEDREILMVFSLLNVMSKSSQVFQSNLLRNS